MELKLHYLCYTNLLLVITLLYFLFQRRATTPMIEYFLAALLVVTMVCSQLLWSHPIQQSTLHKIDAVVAKFVLLCFILYTLVFKFKYSYVLVLAAIFISFYFSHLYSSQEWGCRSHVKCHGLAHVFCFVGTFYAFLPM
jgi:hypothetical protein